MTKPMTEPSGTPNKYFEHLESVDDGHQGTHYVGCWKSHHRCAIAEAGRLERALSLAQSQLAEANKRVSELLNSECDKIMAMPDLQVHGLIAATGQRPEDAAKLAEQAAQIAVLRFDLQKAERERDEMRERLCKDISKVLQSLVEHNDPTLWLNNRYIRWGLVEKRLHMLVDDAIRQLPEKEG